MQLALEIIAALTGIGCVYLQTREKILAWPLGIVSVSVSIYLFFHSQLYSDVLLHVVYVILNVYGWWNWANRRVTPDQPAPILQLGKSGWVVWPLVLAAGTYALGYVMGTYLGASLPFFDAFTTVGSFIAQFLLARKVLQNWLLWIVVDVVAVNVYIYKGLYVIALLFAVYLVLCIKGYIDWKRSATPRSPSWQGGDANLSRRQVRPR